MKFVRFGGLSPVKQEHYKTGADKTFHNPPRKHGIYAFPYPYIEKFLISSTDEPGHVSNKSRWLLDDDGNKVEDIEDRRDYEFDSIKGDRIFYNTFMKRLLRKNGISGKDVSTHRHKDGKHYFTVVKPPRTFEYDGELWCHLGEIIKPGQALDTSGSWVLLDMETYKAALKKEKHSSLKHLQQLLGFDPGSRPNDPFKGRGNIAKDHLEVFIEKL